MRLSTSLFLALAAGLLVTRVAFGHGDAQWIADGEYKGDDDIHCCGPADCSVLPDDAVEDHVTLGKPEYWVIKVNGQVFHEGDKGLHTSIDERYWGCVKRSGDYRDHGMGGEAPAPKPVHYRCLFVPRPST